MTPSAIDPEIHGKIEIKQLAYDFDGEFIHVKLVRGFEVTSKSMEELWIFLGKVCPENNCSKVLVQAKSPRRTLNTMGAFDSGIQASKAIRQLKAALCFENYKPDELSEFFKTVARNRGASIEFFQDFDTARKWLLSTKP